MNIIKKEKARQKQILDIGVTAIGIKESFIFFHKKSLIYLREYMEEELEFLSDPIVSYPGDLVPDRQIRVEKDVKQLTKMIEAYK